VVFGVNASLKYAPVEDFHNYVQHTGQAATKVPSLTCHSSFQAQQPMVKYIHSNPHILASSIFT